MIFSIDLIMTCRAGLDLATQQSCDQRGVFLFLIYYVQSQYCKCTPYTIRAAYDADRSAAPTILAILHEGLRLLQPSSKLSAFLLSYNGSQSKGGRGTSAQGNA